MVFGYVRMSLETLVEPGHRSKRTPTLGIGDPIMFSKVLRNFLNKCLSKKRIGPQPTLSLPRPPEISPRQAMNQYSTPLCTKLLQAWLQSNIPGEGRKPFVTGYGRLSADPPVGAEQDDPYAQADKRPQLDPFERELREVVRQKTAACPRPLQRPSVQGTEGMMPVQPEAVEKLEAGIEQRGPLRRKIAERRSSSGIP